MQVAFDLRGQIAHGLLGDDASLAAVNGCFRLIERGNQVGARALPLLPQGKSFLYRFFLAMEPSGLDGLAD